MGGSIEELSYSNSLHVDKALKHGVYVFPQGSVKTQVEAAVRSLTGLSAKFVGGARVFVVRSSSILRSALEAASAFEAQDSTTSSLSSFPLPGSSRKPGRAALSRVESSPTAFLAAWNAPAAAPATRGTDPQQSEGKAKPVTKPDFDVAQKILKRGKEKRVFYTSARKLIDYAALNKQAEPTPVPNETPEPRTGPRMVSSRAMSLRRFSRPHIGGRAGVASPRSRRNLISLSNATGAGGIPGHRMRKTRKSAHAAIPTKSKMGGITIVTRRQGDLRRPTGTTSRQNASFSRRGAVTKPKGPNFPAVVIEDTDGLYEPFFKEFPWDPTSKVPTTPHLYLDQDHLQASGSLFLPGITPKYIPSPSPPPPRQGPSSSSNTVSYPDQVVPEEDLEETKPNKSASSKSTKSKSAKSKSAKSKSAKSKSAKSKSAKSKSDKAKSKSKSKSKSSAKAVGKSRKSASKRTRNKPRSGYCECCVVNFRDYDKHIVSPRHLEYANNDFNYADIDELRTLLDAHVKGSPELQDSRSVSLSRSPTPSRMDLSATGGDVHPSVFKTPVPPTPSTARTILESPSKADDTASAIKTRLAQTSTQIRAQLDAIGSDSDDDRDDDRENAVNGDADDPVQAMDVVHGGGDVVEESGGDLLDQLSHDESAWQSIANGLTPANPSANGVGGAGGAGGVGGVGGVGGGGSRMRTKNSTRVGGGGAASAGGAEASTTGSSRMARGGRGGRGRGKQNGGETLVAVATAASSSSSLSGSLSTLIDLIKTPSVGKGAASTTSTTGGIKLDRTLSMARPVHSSIPPRMRNVPKPKSKSKPKPKPMPKPLPKPEEMRTGGATKSSPNSLSSSSLSSSAPLGSFESSSQLSSRKEGSNALYEASGFLSPGSPRKRLVKSMQAKQTRVKKDNVPIPAYVADVEGENKTLIGPDANQGKGDDPILLLPDDPVTPPRTHHTENAVAGRSNYAASRSTFVGSRMGGRGIKRGRSKLRDASNKMMMSIMSLPRPEFVASAVPASDDEPLNATTTAMMVGDDGEDEAGSPPRKKSHLLVSAPLRSPNVQAATTDDFVVNFDPEDEGGRPSKPRFDKRTLV